MAIGTTTHCTRSRIKPARPAGGFINARFIPMDFKRQIYRKLMTGLWIVRQNKSVF